jgi:hypothetical protein
MANFPFQPQPMQQQYFAMPPQSQPQQQSQVNAQYQEFLARTQQQLPQIPLNLASSAFAQPPNFFKPPPTTNTMPMFNPATNAASGTAPGNQQSSFDSLVQQTIANHMNQQQHGHSQHDHSGHGHSH